MIATTPRRRGPEYTQSLWLDDRGILWRLDPDGDHERLGHVASTDAEEAADSRGLTEEYGRLLDLWETTDDLRDLHREWGAR